MLHHFPKCKNYLCLQAPLVKEELYNIKRDFSPSQLSRYQAVEKQHSWLVLNVTTDLLSVNHLSNLCRCPWHDLPILSSFFTSVCHFGSDETDIWGVGTCRPNMPWIRVCAVTWSLLAAVLWVVIRLRGKPTYRTTCWPKSLWTTSRRLLKLISEKS